MGWAKYMEDNVSRYWRDANTQLRMGNMTGEKLGSSSDQQAGILETLKMFANRLKMDPWDSVAKQALEAEKVRLLKKGVSPSAIKEITGQQGDGSAACNMIDSKEKGGEKMLKSFTIAAARPLPVIVLADVSGSMSSEGKIENLNRSLREMIRSFSAEDDLRAEIHVGVITFGGSAAEAKHPLAPASKLAWDDLKASGKTPLGSALALAAAWLEDRTIIPSRAYMPTLVLVSDGQPDKGDKWDEELQKLLGSQRGAKAQRLALAIGSDADEGVLKAFVANPDIPVLHVKDASQISRFFRFVTMSVCSRLASINPDVPVAPERFDLENFEDF